MSEKEKQLTYKDLLDVMQKISEDENYKDYTPELTQITMLVANHMIEVANKDKSEDEKIKDLEEVLKG